MPKVSSEVIKSYLTKYPDTPSKTLSSLIYKENSELFPTQEAVRTSIRYWRGKLGKEHRKSASTREFFKKYNGKFNPFSLLPDGKTYSKDSETVTLAGSKFLVLCDVHVPYHDKEALSLALQYGVDNKADHIIINGDFCDFFSISRFMKDPREIDFASELATCIEVLTAIRSAFPKAKITFKTGNHESRLIKYLEIKAPELLGVDWLDFKNLLELDELKIDVVGSLNPMKIGKHLFVIHGHELGVTNSSVNPARGYFTKGRECLIAGHLHRTSQHGEKSIKDTITQCWSVGCLCDMKPQYHPINNWNHGFAFITSNGDDFQVTNKIIIKGKIQS